MGKYGQAAIDNEETENYIPMNAPDYLPLAV